MDKIKKAIVLAVAGVAIGAAGATVGVLATKPDDVQITIDYNVPSVVDHQQKVKKDTTIADLKIEPVEGYQFKGFYKDEACTQKYLANEVVKADSVIYVKLEVVTYAVVFPTSEYYTISQTSSIVNYGDSMSFTITKQDGALDAEPIVKVNGTTITPSAGVYTISDIRANKYVTVEGIEPELYAVSLIVDNEVSYTTKVEPGTMFSSIYNDLRDSISYGLSCGFFVDQELMTVFDSTQDFAIEQPFNIYTKMATMDEFEIQGDSLYLKDDSTATEIVLPILYPGIPDISDSTYVENIVLPSECTIIGDEAFKYSNIKSVNIHNNIQKIESYAFAGSKIERLIINHNVLVCDRVFQGCANLKYVYWNSVFEEVGNNWVQLLFADCKIETFIVGKDVEKFDVSYLWADGANYFGGYSCMYPVDEFIYEASTKTLVDSVCYAPAKNIIINDQNRFDSINGKINPIKQIGELTDYPNAYFAENFGTFYIKQDIVGADSFHLAELNLGNYGLDGEIAFTSYGLETQGEYAGYYKYVVDYESPVVTIYLNGEELIKAKVASNRTVYDIKSLRSTLRIEGDVSVYLDSSKQNLAGNDTQITQDMNLYFFTETN